MATARPVTPSTSNVASGAPTASVSPAATWSLATRPANGAGTSTVALGRLDLDERLVQGDRVALGDEPRADDRLLETLAQVGQGEDALGHQ